MKKCFQDSFWFGCFLFGLAVFIFLVVCIVVGALSVQQDRITQRQRVQACASIKDELIRTTCINGY